MGCHIQSLVRGANSFEAELYPWKIENFRKKFPKLPITFLASKTLKRPFLRFFNRKTNLGSSVMFPTNIKNSVGALRIWSVLSTPPLTQSIMIRLPKLTHPERDTLQQIFMTQNSGFTHHTPGQARPKFQKQLFGIRNFDTYHQLKKMFHRKTKSTYPLQNLRGWVKMVCSNLQPCRTLWC